MNARSAEPAGHSERPADRHLRRELGHAAEHRVNAGRVCAEQRHHQRDADRIVGAGLPLQQHAGPAADLTAAEHGEDHGRIGWRERGTEQQRLGPAQTEEQMRDVRPGRQR